MRCCPTSSIDVGMPRLCRLGSRGCSSREPTRVATELSSSSIVASQHVCCFVVALMPCEAPQQRTSSTLHTILSCTITKLKPASRYLFHIPANSEFLRSRDRAQRKRSRSSQQLRSGTKFGSSQLLNPRDKIALGDQL